MASFQPNDLILYSSVVKNYALPQGVLTRYQNDWNTFDRIQTFNSNVSTLRATGITGTTNISYYTYVNYVEKTSFQNGQMLHTLYLPNSNWNTVQQN